MATVQKTEIYDPRLGQHYRYPLAQENVFDNCLTGFLVIDSWPEHKFGWRRGAGTNAADVEVPPELIAQAIVGVCQQSFVSVCPGQPNVLKRLHQGDLNVLEFHDSFTAYSGASSTEIGNLCTIRQESQTFEEWIIGGCIEAFALSSEEQKWHGFVLHVPIDLKFFLAQHNKIGCLFYRNGETGEQIIMLRMSPSVELVASDIIRLFQQEKA